MKLQRIVPICLLALLMAAPAAADLCIKTTRIASTYPLTAQMVITVRIEASAPGGMLECMRDGCSGKYLATWDSPCGKGKKEGAVRYGHPVEFYLPICNEAGSLAIMCTSGCIKPQVTYSRGF